MARKDLHKYEHAMAYKYRWLSEALDDMSNEIDYVAKEFGLKTARQINRFFNCVSSLIQEFVTRKKYYIMDMRCEYCTYDRFL